MNGHKFYGLPGLDLTGKTFSLKLECRKPNGVTTRLMRHVDNDANPDDEVLWMVPDDWTPINIIERDNRTGVETVSTQFQMADLMEVRVDPRDAPVGIIPSGEKGQYVQPHSGDEGDPLTDEDVVGPGPTSIDGGEDDGEPIGD